MSTPDQRARDRDRDAAIEVVEAAWADGQIVEADRDHRVGQLLQASTLGEIQMVLHDLQPPAAAATPAAAAVAVRRGPAGPARIVIAVVLTVFLALAAMVVSFVVIVTSVDDPTSSSFTEQPLPGVQPASGVNVLSEEGYGDFVADVEATTGSTEAFEAVLYPGYAVAYLPVDPHSQRYSYWYWDGALDDLETRGTSPGDRFDLAEVDMEVVVGLVERARGLVEEPTSYYAIVRAPNDTDGAAIWAYASNEYAESAYIAATPDGRILTTHAP